MLKRQRSVAFNDREGQARHFLGLADYWRVKSNGGEVVPAEWIEYGDDCWRVVLDGGKVAPAEWIEYGDD